MAYLQEVSLIAIIASFPHQHSLPVLESLQNLSAVLSIGLKTRQKKPVTDAGTSCVTIDKIIAADITTASMVLILFEITFFMQFMK